MRDIPPYERFGEANPARDARLDEYVFKAGDTLSGLTHRVYGDWRLWRIVADRNGIVDVRQIAPGTRLLIPERPLESGAYESL